MKHIAALAVALFAASLCLPCAAQDTDKKFELPATDDGLPGAGPIRRYDWFRNLWKKKRTEFAQRSEKEQGAVVFFGDSITQGWGVDMGGSFPGVKVANRGISGDTTRGMLIRMAEDVVALKPAAVVMLMGTNDLEEGAEPKVIAGNVKLIVDGLRKHNGKRPIILCQVFPSSATKKRPSQKIKEINKLCAAAVRGESRVTVLDTWTLFANKQGDATLPEFPDLLHPNKAGYAKWAAALKPLLASNGFMEKEADSFVAEEGFKSLFNGKDLTGWGLRPSTERDKKSAARWKKSNPNAPPWPIVEKALALKGKKASPDGRYMAINGRLTVTIPPEGRKIQQLWTTEEFGEDFVLKLEFRATPNADSGVFIRGKQLQCRDYLLAGPYKQLKQYRPQQWNELVINVKDQVAHCTCNGEILDAAFKVPKSGPIGLEGDQGQIEYRRIRIGKDDGNLLRTTNSVASWNFDAQNGGEGSIGTKGDEVVFTTTKTTDTDWHVQAYQGGLTLKAGKDYRLTFEMKSPGQITVVALAMINQEDWHSIGLAEEVNTSEDFEEFELEFTATDTVAGKDRIGFVLGRETGKIFLRNLKLVEVK